MPLVEARGLVRTFRHRRAVDDVDLSVGPGGRLAIVGPNGAGKSTLLRLLATLMRPDSGRLEIVGHDILSTPQRARPVIGYLGHDPLVYLDLTAWQNLQLFADLYGVPDSGTRIPDLLRDVGLLPRAHDVVRTFSRGMAQRLGIARLSLHRPRLLLLDEPYTGLDSHGARLLDDLIAGVETPGGVVMVTHDLERAITQADTVITMVAGRVVDRRHTAGLALERFTRDYRALTG